MRSLSPSRPFSIVVVSGLALGILFLMTACATAPKLRYVVAPAPGNPHQLAIALRLDGVPRDSLVLRGHASSEVFRLSDLEVLGPAGASIRVVAGVDTAIVEDRVVDIPRLTLRGPLPSSLQLRYRVEPGKREGDSHMGFTGRCFGYADSEFAMVTGRELFLLPADADVIRRIEVRFALPQGWDAVTPWTQEGDHWIPGIRGTHVAEHLISAATGLGPFHERSFQAGNTRFRLAFESGIPHDQEETAVARLTRVARYVHDLFGRDLGPSYLTIVVPEAPTGDQISGEGWATGQGQTFVPLTGNRLHDFAEELISAYTRHAPYRTEIRSPEEYWLVDGITKLYAWRAVAAAGLIDEDDLARTFAESYVTAFTAAGVERNLEKLYATPNSARLGRETLAPFVLLHLDRELRSAHPGAGGLDAIVRRLFRGKTAPSLWSSLPARPGGWTEFRASFVRGNVLANVNSYFEMTPTHPAPEPPRGKEVRHLTLAYTGDSFGFLENCGCKVNQSGGVARRSTILRELRRKDPDLLLVDAGNAFIKPDKQDEPDYFSRREQALYLQTMDFMRYGAAAIGTTELSYGLDHFRAMGRGVRTPYLAANLLAEGRPIAPPSVLLHAGALRVAVIGLFEPPRGGAAEPAFEAHSSQLTIEDPIQILSRALPSLRRDADLVVAMGRIAPSTVRRLVETCPGVDVVLSVDDDAPTIQRTGTGTSELRKEDPPGFLGGTLVLYTPLRNYGLSSARLGLDRDGRITSAAIENHWLTQEVRDDPAVRGQLDRFYDEVGRIEAAQASVKPLFGGDPVRLEGRYVGAGQCRDCHQREYAQWKTTRHAGAYKTLLDVHRHYQPRCISCHVVGYGTPHGYKVGMPEEPLGNVQCEVCHGPGGEHVASPASTNIRRLVPERVCLECHNPDHSDHFVYSEKLPKVRHDYFEGASRESTLRQTPTYQSEDEIGSARASAPHFATLPSRYIFTTPSSAYRPWVYGPSQFRMSWGEFGWKDHDVDRLTTRRYVGRAPSMSRIISRCMSRFRG